MTLDASKIDSVGVPAVGEFLKKLQVYKVWHRSERCCGKSNDEGLHLAVSPPLLPQAMADVTTAKAMYDKYTAVSPAWEKLRAVVVDNRRPRPVLVQPELQLQGDSEVALKTFEASLQGIVESFQARFPVSIGNAAHPLLRHQLSLYALVAAMLQVKDDELFKTWEYGNTVHKYD